MTEQWTDERLDDVLAAIAADLEVPPAPSFVPSAIVRPLGATGARWRRAVLVAAAVLVLVLAAMVLVTPARNAVARWFGLDVTYDLQPSAVPAATFADGVAPLDVDDAIIRSGLDRERLAAGDLGIPDSAGVPPEGGVLLAWNRGSTTLWVRTTGDSVDVVKRLLAGDQVDSVAGLGEFAVLVDEPHLLETPSRRVGAGRVLWWIDGDNEYRLESALDAPTLVSVARTIG